MRTRSSLSDRFHLIINSIMVLVYAAIGFYLIFRGGRFFPGKSSLFLGAVLLLYAGFRGFNVFKKYKITQNENQ